MTGCRKTSSIVLYYRPLLRKKVLLRYQEYYAAPVAVNVYIEIMRAFVAMRNYITTTTAITAELSEIRAKLALMERADEDNAEAVNDLSEDMRKELDNIYEAIAALSVKVPQARKPRQPIGFKKPEEK